ncbi:HAMP domain-containing sensor histidine kinase [Paenibacillus sp. M1]|uniref:histidine kinase n=1 Tax=Paenibacillus haidiansis TaxID=1574488 RepID=A0ABU7VXJ0_9BACL
MKGFFRAIAIFFALFLVTYCAFLLEMSDGKTENEQMIGNWQILWTNQFDPNLSEEQLENLSGWVDVSKNDPVIPEKPYGAVSQWIKVTLPELKESSPAILFDKVYGREIIVSIDGNRVYESSRSYNYGINSLLIPLSRIHSHQTMYIGIHSETSRIGISDEIRVGNYQDLIKSFVKGNIADFILGSTLIFIAVIMLVCSLFLKSVNMSLWFSLCLVILSCGAIVITYSSFLFWLFDDAGEMFVTLFDLALFLLLPSFTFFFEKIFGVGYGSIIQRYRKFQIGYSVFCLLLLIVNELSHSRFYNIYVFATTDILGYIMIIQFIILICTSTVYAFKGNKEAIIFCIGFLIFAFLGAGELIWFFATSGYYDLFLWKWGVVCFLTSLIIILGRRFAENHEQVVEYSKQLEMFNNELQRSEKMEIISELAASVAHEVRNPLQVTRGFLQLLAEKQQPSDKVYLNMALEELDRASNIITDFLTFAKPEVGKVTTLDILEEFIHIEGILIPMANLQGGKISVHIPKNLHVKGNSSKFKQAFVNIMKNSIEALHGEGNIQVWAYEENNYVTIHIKDNGEGMDEEVLSRLGEPYFSNKTKGTGLGLMVTFRIIEVMNGEIHFNSEKGVGTEVIIRFPSIQKKVDAG